MGLWRGPRAGRQPPGDPPGRLQQHWAAAAADAERHHTGGGAIGGAEPVGEAGDGAGVGAASGGVLGALVGSGIPEPEAHHYLTGFESGAVIVAVHVPETRAAEVRRIFDEEGSRRTQTA